MSDTQGLHVSYFKMEKSLGAWFILEEYTFVFSFQKSFAPKMPSSTGAFIGGFCVL
jgi:hypothetical protein